MDAGELGAGAADGAGAGALLRRHGAPEERAHHDDDELRGDGGHRRAVDRSSATRSRSARRVGGVIGWDPALLGAGRRRPPQAVRGQGRSPSWCSSCSRASSPSSRPALISGAVAERMQLPHLRGLHPRSGRPSSTARWRTGCGPSDGWLFKLGRARLRRRHGGAHLGRRLGAGAGADARAPARRGARARRVAPQQPGAHAHRRGAAVVRLVRLQRRQRGGGRSTPVAGASAGLAFTTTQSAAAAAGLAWMLLERWHHGKVTSLGLASGIVAGLVAITPAAGHVKPWAALVIGALASVVCYGAVQLKGEARLRRQPRRLRGARRGRHPRRAAHRRLLLHAGAGRAAAATPRSSASRRSACWRGDRLRRRRHLRHRQRARSRCGACASTEQEERDGLDLAVHGERGYHFDQT